MKVKKKIISLLVIAFFVTTVVFIFEKADNSRQTFSSQRLSVVLDAGHGALG
jgi:hypothetical protein